MKINYYLLGRWLGDGCKTSKNITIARNNTKEEIKSMEIIAKQLNTQCSHNENNYTTRFEDTKEMVLFFQDFLKNIKNGDLLNKENMFKLIAGFVDSDGSVDYHSPNDGGKLNKSKIKICLYNNNTNILNYINRFLTSEGVSTLFKESYHQTTNMGVIDNCWRLHINSSLDVYYIGNKIKPYLLHSSKRERICKWINQFDEYYQNTKLNFTEIFTSIEGEGRDIGLVKTYIRVKGCPHSCSFCDSKYSIGSRGLSTYKAPTLKTSIRKIVGLGYLDRIEFTGGSPDWFPNKIGYLLIYFKTHYDSKITMQVSGGIPTTSSYKLFKLSDINCFDYKDPRENIPFVIEDGLIREQDEIKFLIKDEESYKFVKNKINELSLKMKCNFIITTITDGTDESMIDNHLKELKLLTEKILNDKQFNKKNVRILPRQHILLWGNKRGV